MVPHQLRGGLRSFQTMNLKGEAFELCTACSKMVSFFFFLRFLKRDQWLMMGGIHVQVIDEYNSKGFDMLLEAFNDPEYLARLTGLDRLNRETEEVMEGLDWDEEDEEAEAV